MLFNFNHASRRNTKCYWVTVAGVSILVSYDTPVAFDGTRRLRRSNDWGPTTGRHMKESGVTNWPIEEDEKVFERKLDEEIVAGIRDSVTRKLAPEIA